MMFVMYYLQKVRFVFIALTSIISKHSTSFMWCPKNLAKLLKPVITTKENSGENKLDKIFFMY